MKTVFQYKIVPIVSNGIDTITADFRMIGQEGYELVQINNGIAYFKRKVELQDGQACHIETQVVKHNNEDVRPINEKLYIIETLDKFNGHKCKAAAVMGISYNTLLRKIKKYSLTARYPLNKRIR
jgi:DNA-binding NtrC family response regulator